MRCHSLLLVAPRTLEWYEEDLPQPGAHQVLVRTIAGAISVGTELPLYRGEHRGSAPVRYPKMTGYESLATVIACGEAVQQPAVGDRVLSFYGHRTHAVLPVQRTIGVPTDIPDPLALLAILSCDVAKGIAKVNVQPNQHVLITGAGAIGCLTLFNLQARSIPTVDIIEPVPQRREVALQLGARKAFAPEALEALSDTYHVGFECSSRNHAFKLLQAQVGYGGRICILADGNLEPLVLTPDFHEKELHIVASSDGLDYHEHAAWFFPYIRNNPILLERLFQVTTTAEQLPQMFEQMANNDTPPIKVFIRYNED
jgi:alcohol dehydrogenase